MDEAMKAAETIAGMSLVALMVAKEAVNRAFETTLAEGIRFERRTFHALFATHDQKEGMAAFVEKRPAKFENRYAARYFRTQITRTTEPFAASLPAGSAESAAIFCWRRAACGSPRPARASCWAQRPASCPQR